MDSETASTKAFDTLLSFFQEGGWEFTRHEGKLKARTSCGSKNGRYACFALVPNDRPILLFFSSAGFRVPQEKRAAMAEFLTRANFGMGVGNFEMDYSDGEVRYKTSVDVADGQLTHGMIKAMLTANILTMDR